MSRIILAVCCVALLSGAAFATTFEPNKTVGLPVPPNPGYTNADSGTITLTTGNPYISVVQNTLNMDHWKEWWIKYTITILDPQADWLADFHIDYSHKLPFPENMWERDMIDPHEAFFQTYYAKRSSPQPLVWVAVGYPSSIGQPLKVNPQNADAVIDTLPFDYNPEWVSLDFVGTNVQVSYEFYDWCIPEPASLSLLGLGAMALLRRRHR